MSKPQLTTLILNDTFNEKDLRFSSWVDPSKLGELVKNPRMAVGHKSWKHAPSPIPREGKYRQNDEFIYLQVNGATSIGIYYSYEYNIVKTNPKLRVPENMNGYVLLVPLINDRDRTTPNESDALYNAFDRLHNEVVNYICEHREGLPKFARDYTKKQLAACINPPFSREKEDKSGKKRGPMLSVPFKYYKADPKKNKQENLITNCNKPGGKFHPKEFVSIPGEKCIPGKVDFIIRLCHLGYSTKVDEKSKDKDMKLSINYNIELQGVNFKPMMKNCEPDLLGSMAAEDEEDNANDDIYGSKPVLKDAEGFGDDDEPPRNMKKREVDDDEDTSSKKTVETQVEKPRKKREESPPRKKREESPEEKPRKSRR